MPEQLRLQQRFRQRRTVDRDERLGPAGRQAVYGASHELFPGAAFTGEKDGRRDRCDQVYLLEDGPDPVRSAYNACVELQLVALELLGQHHLYLFRRRELGKTSIDLIALAERRAAVELGSVQGNDRRPRDPSAQRSPHPLGFLAPRIPSQDESDRRLFHAAVHFERLLDHEDVVAVREHRLSDRDGSLEVFRVDEDESHLIHSRTVTGFTSQEIRRVIHDLGEDLQSVTHS